MYNLIINISRRGARARPPGAAPGAPSPAPPRPSRCISRRARPAGGIPAAVEGAASMRLLHRSTARLRGGVRLLEGSSRGAAGPGVGEGVRPGIYRAQQSNPPLQPLGTRPRVLLAAHRTEGGRPCKLAVTLLWWDGGQGSAVTGQEWCQGGGHPGGADESMAWSCPAGPHGEAACAAEEAA